MAIIFFGQFSDKFFLQETFHLSQHFACYFNVKPPF